MSSWLSRTTLLNSLKNENKEQKKEPSDNRRALFLSDCSISYSLLIIHYSLLIASPATASFSPTTLFFLAAPVRDT